MPLPRSLQPLVSSRRFWTDFLWETEARGEDGQAAYPELQDCMVELPFADGYRLSLSLDKWLSYLSLGLGVAGGETVEIAWDDQAHWHLPSGLLAAGGGE
jgi:hypothetical protein